MKQGNIFFIQLAHFQFPFCLCCYLLRLPLYAILI
nr:MAG TPA: hypothetical protein [Caudoviricetes sp.]